ncbi:MAG: response regulator [Ardenticatenaceae bacterium]
MRIIRVVLIDDHPIVRSGIRTMLEKAPDIVVIGEAGDGASGLRLATELLPDVLLLDMEIPDVNGVEVARQLQAAKSPVRVLALSAYDDERYISGVLACGAAGYLTKEEALKTIVEAVRGVARGEEGWLSRRATAKMMKQNRTRRKSETSPFSTLSLREQQVLRLVAHGYPNSQIADILCISIGTVKNHVSNIYSKLYLRTRAETVAWAWQQGIMER